MCSRIVNVKWNLCAAQVKRNSNYLLPLSDPSDEVEILSKQPYPVTEDFRSPQIKHRSDTNKKRNVMFVNLA